MGRPARPDAREALLGAAREEFARHGLDRARVEDVARRAGVSKGAFYLHFRTKDEAYREIVSRFLGALEDHALRREEVERRTATAEAGLSEPEALAVRVEAECAIDTDLLDLLWRNRHILAAVDGTSGKPYRDLLAGSRRRLRALVAGRLLDWQGAGRLRRDVDPEVAADVVVGAYEYIARRMIDMRTKPDLAAWTRSLLLVLYGGILERPGTAPTARRARARATSS